jgi:DNA-binding transcriptional ArsR family regulator
MIDKQMEREAAVFRALGHPVRLLIARGLLKKECNVNKIVDKLGLPQSSVSQHLGVLRSAGVIRGERKGTMICYRVVDGLARKILEGGM